MRTYLVVIDQTGESAKALRYAARRASRTGGAVTIATFLPPREFVQWGGVQATLDEEARAKAQALVSRAAGTTVSELGVHTAVDVRDGEPIAGVMAMLRERTEDATVAALVLAAAADGAPGPLVQHFAGQDTGRLPCPVMIIPGALSDEEIDRLS